MKKSLLLSLLVLILGLGLLGFNHAVARLSGFKSGIVNINYASGTPLRGTLMLELDSSWQPIWQVISWHWCPRLNPLQWCVNSDGDTFSGEALIGLSFNGITLSNGLLSAEHLPLVLAGFVPAEASIDANIRHAKLHDSRSLDAIAEIDASALFSNVKVLDFTFENHRIDLNRNASDTFSVRINGSEANGEASASVSGDYSAALVLTPKAEIGKLLKNYLNESPDGSFSYTTSGKLPELM